LHALKLRATELESRIDSINQQYQTSLNAYNTFNDRIEAFNQAQRPLGDEANKNSNQIKDFIVEKRDQETKRHALIEKYNRSLKEHGEEEEL
jgi:chromosome segregation ATPase